MRWLLALCVVAGLGSEVAAIEVADPFPVAGHETTIKLSAPADSIDITYQPAAPIAHTVTIPTGGKSEVPWTPERAGIAQVSAGDEKVAVSVKFDGVPGLGLVIFLVAGIILFGGAATCLKALFSQSHEQ